MSIFTRLANRIRLLDEKRRMIAPVKDKYDDYIEKDAQSLYRLSQALGNITKELNEVAAELNAAVMGNKEIREEMLDVVDKQIQVDTVASNLDVFLQNDPDTILAVLGVVDLPILTEALKRDNQAAALVRMALDNLEIDSLSED